VAVDFIDIGGIVDHHCLNFFHKFLYETEWESTIKYKRIGGVMVCVIVENGIKHHNPNPLILFHCITLLKESQLGTEGPEWLNQLGSWIT
jgi:hypothetical protein